MRTFDLTPFYRNSVGFDRLFDILDNGVSRDTGNTYPPYNIERIDDNSYRVSLAVAGFGDDDLSVEVKEDVLTIRGNKPAAEKDNGYLHRGIAARNFERTFHLADHVIVKGAALENGLLHVDLERVVPEEKRPRRIEIAKGTKSGNKRLAA